MEATRAEIAGYAGADLLCYRAEAPEALVAAEAAAFDPVLDWAEQALRREVPGRGEGVVHVRQPAHALQGGPSRARADRERVRAGGAARHGRA